MKIVADLGHSDSIVMGSDYPHGEGFADPTDFADLIADLDPAEQKRILRDNALVLVDRA
jgi:predicted TIM-barrel fold metal-dependent hydrolase